MNDPRITPIQWTMDEAREWLASARKAIDLDEGSNDEEHDRLLEVMEAVDEACGTEAA